MRIRCMMVPSKRREGRKRVTHNIRCKNTIESTTEVTKGIENRVEIHGDCASLVVVSGGMLLVSEYEGQVSH